MKINFDAPPTSAQETNGLEVRYAAAKRRVPRWRWYLLLAMVLVAPAYLLVRFGIAYWWESTPAQVVLEQATLRAPAAGRVAFVAATGAPLEPGQPVMALERTPTDTSAPPAATPSPTPHAQEPAQAQAHTARLALLTEAERLASRRLAIQQERLHTMQGLREQGAATRQEVDNLRFQVLQAEADLSRARADVREQRMLMARVPAAMPAPAAPATPQPPADEAAPAQPGTALAPFAATAVQALVRPGDWVAQGAEVAVLQRRGEPLVHAYLPPDKARYAQVGRMATLHFMDGGKVRAKVVGLMMEAQSPPADRVSPLTPRTPSIVVKLQALEPLPAPYHIHQLPLDVRFDWVASRWF